MADEETPFDDLDIGYFEFPLPTTQELTVVRFLDKTGVARLWAKIQDKFFKIPSGGEAGQFLSKTETGYSWEDASTVQEEISKETASTYFENSQDNSLDDLFITYENARHVFNEYFDTYFNFATTQEVIEYLDS